MLISEELETLSDMLSTLLWTSSSGKRPMGESCRGVRSATIHRDAESACSRELRGCKGLEEGRGMTTPALWDLSIAGLQAPP